MNVDIQPVPTGVEFADDLLIGVYEIAEFLFGNRNKPRNPKAERRAVYHLAETSRLPVFRLGTRLCARRSVLTAWVAEQEQRGQSRTSRR